MSPHFRRLLLQSAAGLAITLLWVLHAAGAIALPAIDSFERWLYDKRLVLTAPRGLDQRVVIIDIDQRSLARDGHWPWRRDRVAALLHILFDEYDVGLVAFDLPFAEADRRSGLMLLEELSRSWLRDDPQFHTVLESLRPALDWDQRLADAMRGRNVLLGYYFSAGTATGAGALPEPIPVLAPRPPAQLPLPRASGYMGIYPPVLEAAAGAGFLDNPAVDPDGVHRRLPLLQLYHGQPYEALALAVVRRLHGSPPLELELRTALRPGQGRLEAVRLGGFRVPVDGAGRVLVPYRGRQGSFPYVSAAAVLEREVDPAVLRDAIVLIGMTNPELAGIRSTPVETAYPGVEIHANLISGILDGRVRYAPDFAVPLELLLLAVLGVLLTVLLPQIPPLWSLLLTGGLAVGVTGLNLYFWIGRGQVVPLGSSYLLIGLLFVLYMVLGFMRERHLKGRLAERFGQYVPPALVERMSESPDQEYGFSGESRDMTVLFADLRGFTGIAETMEPHELTRFMHEWLTPMTRIIHRHGGTVDKYMGDCVMAFWGAPLPDPEHAAHALDAAMEMLAEIPRLNRQFARRGWPQLRLGIGVNSGEMRVGNMGSEFRVTYTVLGDAVNLGSRLESLTLRYGVPIIVGAAVRAKAPAYEYIELDRVRVKGKRTPVSIYYPLGVKGLVAPELIAEAEQYRRALAHYLRQGWEPAERIFAHLAQGGHFQQLYQIYLDRIAHYRAEPPGPGWSGVFTDTRE